MPWHIEDDHPGCDGFAVVKDGTDEVEGCHMSRDMANQQLAALYANERSLPRGFPSQVAARLDNLESMCTRHRGVLSEARAISRKVEVREVTADSARVVGYATVYGWPYDVAGGPPHGFRETIAHGAAKRSIKNHASRADVGDDVDDVRLLVNHEGGPLARTKSGTLILVSDDTGLFVDATLDLRSTDARNAMVAMERGDLDEMSFAFQVLDQEWNTDYTERLIREVKLFDVSLVTYPANPAASAYLGRREKTPARGMSFALARAEAEALSLRI